MKDNNKNVPPFQVGDVVVRTNGQPFSHVIKHEHHNEITHPYEAVVEYVEEWQLPGGGRYWAVHMENIDSGKHYIKSTDLKLAVPTTTKHISKTEILDLMSEAFLRGVNANGKLEDLKHPNYVKTMVESLWKTQHDKR